MTLTKWGVGAAALAGIFAIGFGEVSDAHRQAPAPIAPERADAEAALTLASNRTSGAQIEFLKWAHAFSSTEPEDRLALSVRTGPEDRYVEVSRGDTLMGILTERT